MNGHDKPDSANNVAVARATGAPSFSAAVRFCPMAKAQFPMRAQQEQRRRRRNDKEPKPRHAVAEKMLSRDRLRKGGGKPDHDGKAARSHREDPATNQRSRQSNDERRKTPCEPG